MKSRGFWFESPITCRDIFISFAEIEELAAEKDGYEGKAEDMDDMMFYDYCTQIAERVFEECGR